MKPKLIYQNASHTLRSINQACRCHSYRGCRPPILVSEGRFTPIVPLFLFRCDDPQCMLFFQVGRPLCIQVHYTQVLQDQVYSGRKYSGWYEYVFPGVSLHHPLVQVILGSWLVS